MNSRKQPVVFCDFDGTITVNDNILAIIKHFNPEGWEPIVQDIMGERKSIRRGVGELFELLPSSSKKEVVDFALSQARIREGFGEFLAFCRQRGIEFYVTSGGIDFFVYPILAPFDIPEDHIFCNGSDFSGERIRITWPHQCQKPCTNDCGMCKTTIIRRFPAERYDRILIGDSVTDFAGAKLVDHVYARSHLTEKCEQLGLPHVPYENFYDIITAWKCHS
ncbi:MULTISPECIES: 2-hydroxy-3-keto-5-methylthiopentenyl-1-phosphate phosphatase [unclassified Paenibacillus]|uniref:2-hydroxy-3-keto-5-methylthiopentenyl-1- phosphate phosphatase n=1 Tax=unclassified Paenibacillus TaxID=185978 RepID=UPI001C126F97|nr:MULTISPECIES: 2-hydroxy-3-keto-5-methylthiopentenyl-1-phosphate phosphatase [unclassified Paenibacillus]MBU5444028.1 2-hydroxy-3-keto-5-methylthiopentenyl-1-phosphate phosphatase [Paenibacillus sp. MSJ-34]CAH0122231.1 2-hydroxy-3-keto-5-methylthiopentenyl-1-phosphatephosphatase [Paenibacillus sp. CECT 9249]